GRRKRKSEENPPRLQACRFDSDLRQHQSALMRTRAVLGDGYESRVDPTTCCDSGTASMAYAPASDLAVRRCPTRESRWLRGGACRAFRPYLHRPGGGLHYPSHLSVGRA